jgi:MFS family permease
VDRASQTSAALLRDPAFAFLWTSRVLSNVAFHMLGVAVAWQLYTLTGSALDLGLVGLVQFVPMVILTLIVGQVADRYDRRVIAIVCQVVQAAVTVVLTLAILGHWESKVGILSLIALLGAARAFENPSTTALVSDVVTRPFITRAMAWVISANQTAQIVSPALGGFLYALGPVVAYATAGALFVLASAGAALVRTRHSARVPEPSRSPPSSRDSPSSGAGPCCSAS